MKTSFRQIDLTVPTPNALLAQLNLQGSGVDDTLSGSSGADILSGLSGSDLIQGQGGNDTLLGGAGADTLDGGTGIDQLDGGSGHDSYVVDQPSDVIIEGLGNGFDTVYASLNWVLGKNIEHLVLTGTAALNGTGNALRNQLTGNDGNNRLSGMNGADTLYGQGGSDVLNGGRGHDELYGGSGRDTLLGGVGNDLLDGGIGHDSVDGGSGNDMVFDNGTVGDTLIGGDGYDYLKADWSGSQSTIYWVDSGIGAEAVGNELVESFEFYDLQFGSGNDTIWAKASLGATLDGGLGSDLIRGGDYNDLIYISGSDADQAFGELGEDTLVADISTYAEDLDWTVDNSVTQTVGLIRIGGFEEVHVTLGAGNDTVRVASTRLDIDAVNVNGGGGNDSITGSNLADTLAGGLGDNTLVGGKGTDVIYCEGFDEKNQIWLTDRTRVEDKIYGLQTGSDVVVISQSVMSIGDYDSKLTGVYVTSTDTIGAFDELIICTTPTSGELTAAAAAAVLPHASQAFTAAQSALVVVSNGTDSALFFFEEYYQNTDKVISDTELTLIATLYGHANASFSDFALIP